MRHVIALLLLTLLPLSAASAAEGPRIEVAFVLDATGSMGPWIKQARERIKDIAADLATGDPQPDARFALVRYRDKGDAYLTQTVPFTGDIEAMRGALDATKAQGGGDTPEAVIEALQEAIDGLKWSKSDNALKLIYLVGDASPKHYPNAPTLDVLARKALEKGIIIHSIACGSMAGRGQRFFESVARMSEGRAFRLGHHTVARGATSTAGAKGASSLGDAVSGSAKAYSGSVGVDFKGAPIAGRAFEVPAVDVSGLLGGHARLIADNATWLDLWAAHTSLDKNAAPAPTLDFGAHQVLVLGGADEGLQLEGLATDGTRRVADVSICAPGPVFYLIPVADGPVVVRHPGA